jgi:hypothetical protein
LVLTDVSMPQLGGPELDRYVKTHWPKMPLVLQIRKTPSESKGPRSRRVRVLQRRSLERRSLAWVGKHGCNLAPGHDAARIATSLELVDFAGDNPQRAATIPGAARPRIDQGGSS